MRNKRQSEENTPHKPFDVTTKQLVEADPQAWLEYVGLPPAEVDAVTNGAGIAAGIAKGFMGSNVPLDRTAVRGRVDTPVTNSPYAR
jgi:hypothetical protein